MFNLTQIGNFHRIFIMKVFITGGTGFIGSHLIDFLLNKYKVRIYALVRNRNNTKWLNGLDVQLLEGNLFSIPSLPSDIDYVFHLAGLTKAYNSGAYYTVNQEGTASLFKSIVAQKVYPKKIIYLSTLAATGPSFNGQPVKEDSEAQPVTPYGKSKLLGEKEALKFKNEFPLVIIRVGAVFGPRDKDFLPYFRIIQKGALPSIGHKQRLLSMCYVKDLIHALDLSTQKDLKSGEIIHIADPQPYSWDEFGKIVAKGLGKSARTVKIPFPALFLAALAFDLSSRVSKKPSPLNLYKFKEMKQKGWVADTTKAKELLSFYPKYSLQEAIQETIDWYLENKWL